jgi:predicted transcriptional regulator
MTDIIGFEGKDEENIKEIQKREKEARDEVEKFVQRMMDFEIMIDPKTSEIWYTDNAKPSTKISLSNYLSRLIDTYGFMKNTSFGGQYAENCLRVIRQIYSNGLIKEGTGAVGKLSQANKEIAQLKNEIQNCQNERQRLASEFLILKGQKQELEEKLNKAFKSKGGDIPR